MSPDLAVPAIAGRPPRTPDLGGWRGPVVDADAHVRIGSLQTLYPHVPRGWRERIEASAFPPLSTLDPMYPPNAPTTARAAWRPSDGRPPASSLELLREELLDPFGVEIAIVSANWGIEAIRHPDLAAVLARATNDWVVSELLERDDRIRASITVVHHDPAEAIREIERVGNHPGFVQVFLPVWSQHQWGKRLWHPLFESIAAHDLVAGIHYGGTPDGPPTSTGWPSYYAEHYAAATQMYLTQLVSIVGEGLLQAVPDLRISMLEGGFSWMPGMLWRMNKEWKGLRRDVPWIATPPADLVRERIRVSTQPLDGASTAELTRIVEWLGSHEMLMYASDYPHDHADDIATLLAAMPDDARGCVMAGNARRHYRL